MKERFSQIIEELGTLLEMDLSLDANDSCDLVVEESLSIQIEETDEEEIIIGSFLGELLAGKFREELLHHALLANHLPHEGAFGYNEPNNQLTYFTFLPMKEITAFRLQETLAAFSDVALSWYEAIKKAETHPESKSLTSPSQNPFFNP